jgi:hypothetical protein
MTTPGRAHGPGETGGLPGANADPRTAEISDEERADTVSGTGTPAGGAPAEGDLDDADPGRNG